MCNNNNYRRCHELEKEREDRRGWRGEGRHRNNEINSAHKILQKKKIFFLNRKKFIPCAQKQVGWHQGKKYAGESLKESCGTQERHNQRGGCKERRVLC